MNSEAFHVVDFKAQIRLEQDRAIDDCARPDVSDWNAPDLHNQSLGPAEAALQDQKIPVWQKSGVSDVEFFNSF